MGASGDCRIENLFGEVFFGIPEWLREESEYPSDDRHDRRVKYRLSVAPTADSIMGMDVMRWPRQDLKNQTDGEKSVLLEP